VVRAIARRAFDLGLIDAAQYRTANIQLVKTGKAKEERYDDSLLAFRSDSVIAEVTPKEGSPASLPQTVLRLPLETAVEVLPALSPARAKSPQPARPLRRCSGKSSSKLGANPA
jgi:hypothetical protein